MPILKLDDNPNLFNDAVELYHHYLLDSWVPSFKCTLAVEEVRNQVQESLVDERDYFLSVLGDGTCTWITFGELSREYERLYNTWWVFVLPKYRRNAIATYLKEHQISFVRWENIYDWIFSKIHKSNEWLVKLHRKLGFRIIPDERSEWNMAGLELT